MVKENESNTFHHGFAGAVLEAAVKMRSAMAA